MASLSFNAEDFVEEQRFEPIPEALYKAVIIDSEMRKTNAGTGSYLMLKFEVLEGAQAVRPESSGTGAVGEATEGRLVEVVGRILRGPTDDLPYGYSLYIDDGSGEVQVFIPASTGINPFRIGYLRPGVTIRVTGLSSQFLANLEVLPRIVGDIQRSR